MRVAVAAACILAASAVCASASGQSLADAAAKEAARRATIKEPGKVYTDKDVPNAGQASPAKTAPAKASESKRPASTRPSRETPPTDDNGHDEQWWKGRANGLRAKWNEATALLEIARRRADAISADTSRSASNARLSPAMRGVHAEVERRAAEVRRALRALSDLEEEARKAGALPGWLRQ
jgi:hypothetical protein